MKQYGGRFRFEIRTDNLKMCPQNQMEKYLVWETWPVKDTVGRGGEVKRRDNLYKCKVIREGAKFKRDTRLEQVR